MEAVHGWFKSAGWRKLCETHGDHIYNKPWIISDLTELLNKKKKASGLESGRSAVWPEGEAHMQGLQQEEAGSQAWAEKHDRRVEQ